MDDFRKEIVFFCYILNFRKRLNHQKHLSEGIKFFLIASDKCFFYFILWVLLQTEANPCTYRSRFGTGGLV